MIGNSFLSRRQFASSIVATASLASCRRAVNYTDGKIHLTFATWGGVAEIAGFQRVIDRFHALRKDVRIIITPISYHGKNQVDAQIAANVGPDLLRVEYLDIGRYSPSNALIDLSKYVPSNLGDEFTAQSWAAVLYRDRPHALPHQTDTSAILYNRGVFKRLGITPPDTIEKSWSWNEFTDVARFLQRRAGPYAFAMNWTHGGSFRWLNFLYQHGGKLLADDFKTSAIPSQAALETLLWTRSWFREGLVPPSDSVRSVEQIENLFLTGVVSMYFDVGPQGMVELKTPFEWGATYLPQDRCRASELGGNAIGVTRNCKYPEAAASFAAFLTNEANMLDFVRSSDYLPVRRRLFETPIVYPRYADEMRVHLEQSRTVPLDLARTVTLPDFHRMRRILADELDLTFAGDQDPEQSLLQMARAINRGRATT